MHDDIANAISQKNAPIAIRLLLGGNPPRPRLGRGTENDLWDFKADCPSQLHDERTENAWAHIAADVLAFHNNRGGLLIFGLDDSHNFVGATRILDSKKFNDRIRRYVGDTLWVDYYREYIQPDQKYLGVALIPPRGPSVARFKASAPSIGGKRHFERGGSSLREHDSTMILSPNAADRFARDQAAPVYGEKYSVDEPFFRVLAPEYLHFLERPDIGNRIEKSLRDPRISVTSLIGVGGMGKTALATWAANRAYASGDFSFIVSTTAKDRELSASGILGLSAPLTSFEDLLDQICDVLGFPEEKENSTQARESVIRSVISESNGLLFVDNLETIDDKRLISFLDDLPLGVRALVTSRRNSVRTAARPIDIPALTDKELVGFVRLLATEQAFKHAAAMSDAQAVEFGRAWDGIPLALRWALSRTKSVAELVQQASISTGQRLHGDQLLEFSFRRVFERLTPAERAVLETLAILEQPLPTEAVVAGAGVADDRALDAVEELVDDGLAQRVFDSDRNDFCFTILPITRAFVRHDFQKHPGASRAAQRRLSSWFEATDIENEEQRLLVREVRAGKNSDDTALVDLAIAAERRGDYDGAEKLYQQARARNPRSWRAARVSAEFYRHCRRDHLQALALYEVAGSNAPKQGSERAVIYREWGILLRDSGRPDAVSSAEEKLLVSHEENPSDPIARHALATCYDRRGAYRLVIELLEPVRETSNSKTREKSLPLLLKAYQKANEPIKEAELRRALSTR
ncbi:RNA-binding domain-containing protein [Cellulomonas sp. SLBN-39]|uniref:RNA-binding domain-containing protein n=1 Tax=Cellulomonas sp. SLBN-39 TaxID=2768446 RepID=UPI001357A44E|nr:RNA-binding domain-containing protein [Cellulomonas sp. SLBN-39]